MKYDLFVLLVRRRICPGNAIWNRTGVTVAGQENGTCSTSLSGLNNPNDVYVLGNGTLYIPDYGNNRIVCWYPNSNVGMLVAGTGAYGSWSTLLARPAAIASRFFNSIIYLHIASLVFSSSSRQSNICIRCGKLSSTSRNESFVTSFIEENEISSTRFFLSITM